MLVFTDEAFRHSGLRQPASLTPRRVTKNLIQIVMFASVKWSIYILFRNVYFCLAVVNTNFVSGENSSYKMFLIVHLIQVTME